MRSVPPKVLEAVLDAASTVLAEAGSSALTIDRVAAGAGTSRTSLHRYGLGLAEMRAALAQRLLLQAREELFPVLAARAGPAAAQLEQVLRVIFRVADRNLPIFAALLSDDRGAVGSPGLPWDQPDSVLVEPLLGVLRAGRVDGSLRVEDGAEQAYAHALFSTAVAGYVRLRWFRRVAAPQAEEVVLGLTLNGLRSPLAVS